MGADTKTKDKVCIDCVQFGAEVFECNHWAEGGAGTIELAEHVSKLADSGQSQFRPLYDDHLSLWEKVRTVARTIYGADGSRGTARSA